MQTSVPLARAVGNAAVVSRPSCIPHITYHITRKINPSQKSTAASRSSPFSSCSSLAAAPHSVRGPISRCRTKRRSCAGSSLQKTLSYSTIALSPDEIHDVERDAATEVANDARRATSRPVFDDSATNITASEIESWKTTNKYDAMEVLDLLNIETLLKEGNSEAVFAWLSYHPDGQLFTKTVDAATWEAAFVLIDPLEMVEPLKRMLAHTGYATPPRRVLHHERDLQKPLKEFCKRIHEMFIARQTAGQKLSLAACKHALKCYERAGDGVLARDMWNTFMPAYGLTPDVECYNAYMGALVWDRGFSWVNHHRLRNTSHNLAHRAAPVERRPAAFKNYTVASKDSKAEPSKSIKSVVLDIFQTILTKGLKPNEATFRNMIVGLARAADVQSVDSILKSVWNVDPDALEHTDEEELVSPTFYDYGHELRPTEDLLYAIVHAYCVNNHAARAWKVLDYMSRSYAMDVPMHVWHELSGWVHALNIKRSLINRKFRGRAVGKISYEQARDLWSTLMDIPYSVEPTSVIQNQRARNLKESKGRYELVVLLRDIETKMLSDLKHLKDLGDQITVLAQQGDTTKSTSISRAILRLRQEYRKTFVDATHGFETIIANVRRMMREVLYRPHDGWTRRDLLRAADEFAAYLPHKIVYNIPTGHVVLETLGAGNLTPRWQQLQRDFADAIVLWTSLNTFDLYLVLENLRALPRRLEAQRQIVKHQERLDEKEYPLRQAQVEQELAFLKAELERASKSDQP